MARMARMARIFRMGDIRCGSGDGVRCAAEIKVLKDLGLLFLLGIYRHSGPCGPGAAFCRRLAAAWRGAIILAILRILAILIQTRRRSRKYGEKVWKTLMSIAPPRQQGEKVLKDLNGCNV